MLSFSLLPSPLKVSFLTRLAVGMAWKFTDMLEEYGAFKEPQVNFALRFESLSDSSCRGLVDANGVRAGQLQARRGTRGPKSVGSKDASTGDPNRAEWIQSARALVLH